MALKSIKDFPKATPSTEDLILIEQQGEGRSTPLSELPVSTPVNTRITGEVNSLKSRIDNIVASSGDDISEIVDARQGSDGTNYASLKARLDAEHSELKGDIGDIYSVTGNTNIFDKNDYTGGYWAQAGIGGSTSTDYRAYAPIKLEKGKHYSSSNNAFRTSFSRYATTTDSTNKLLLTELGSSAIKTGSTFMYFDDFVPDEDIYVFLTVGISTSDVNEIMLVDDSILPIEYKAYGELYNKIENGVLIEKIQNIHESFVNKQDFEEVKNLLVDSFDYQYLDHNDFSIGYCQKKTDTQIYVNKGNPEYFYVIITDMKAGKYNYTWLHSEFTWIQNKDTNEVESIKTYNENVEGMSSGSFTVPYDFNIYATTTMTFRDNAMISDGDIPYNYIYGKYNVQVKSEAFKSDLRQNIYVKQDGSGDFTTIVDAVAYAQKHKNCTIHIGSGVYDLIEELGPDYTESLTSDGRAGLKLGNGMRLIFDSNAKVISHYRGSNIKMHNLYSPFNNMAPNYGGFSIENLTLECSNCRYGIHDETAGQDGFYRNHYKNCKIYFDNTMNDDFPARQCIGGGLGKNAEIIIENCIFESVQRISETSGTGIVSYHNTTGVSADDNIRSTIVIKNSYFANNDTVKVSYLGKQTAISTAIVSGCSLGSAPYVMAEGTDNVENMRLYAFANEIRNT